MPHIAFNIYAGDTNPTNGSISGWIVLIPFLKINANHCFFHDEGKCLIPKLHEDGR